MKLKIICFLTPVSLLLSRDGARLYGIMISGEAEKKCEARKPAGYSYIGKHMIAEFFADVDTMNVDQKH